MAKDDIDADKAVTSADAVDAGDSAPEEDLKAKFRAALERKKGHQTDAHIDADGKASGLGGAHGPLAHKREFRRKSG